MKAILGPRGAVRTVLLIAAWCALWRELSVANVLAGTAVALVVQLVGPADGPRPLGSIRAMGHITWLVSKDLVLSTVNVAKRVLSRSQNTDESIVAIQLPPLSRGQLLFLVVAVNLTPGTAVVDVKPESQTIYLHLLDHAEAATTAVHVIVLATLSAQAFPAPGSEIAAHDFEKRISQ